MEEIFDALRERIGSQSARAGDRIRAAGADQINDLAGVDRPIEVKVFGPDVAQLRELAEQVGEHRRGRLRASTDVNPHVHLGNPDIVVRPDSVQTARVGLTELDVENQLNAALYGQVASTVPEQDRMTNIRVRYPDRVRFDRRPAGRVADQSGGGQPASQLRPHARRRRRLVGSRSGFVPLGQLASIDVVRSPNELWRENQQPVITVTAELDDRDLGAVNRDLQARAGRS